VRDHARDRSQAQDHELVVLQERCPFCQTRLWAAKRRERYVVTLEKMLRLRIQERHCPNPACRGPRVRYRPAEEGRLVLKAHEFGLDVVVFAGEQYHRQHVSIPKIHQGLQGEHRVPICERSVGNLIDDYEALCECVAGDSDRLRTRLKKQGAIVLAVDGVQYDDRSPVLYVQRDVLSGELMYAERRLARGAKDLVPMLGKTAELARQIEVPIIGIVSDKERSLVPAIAEVFPKTPHQFCQQHYLANAAKPLGKDNERLEEAAREVVSALRDVQRQIERRGPQVTAAASPQREAARSAPPDLTARGRADEPAMAPPAAPPSSEAVAASPPASIGTSRGRLDSVPPREASDPGAPPSPVAPIGQAARETALADALARAGATVGKVSGRPTVDPAGLKRFERLDEVRAAAQKAAQKKGVRRAAGR